VLTVAGFSCAKKKKHRSIEVAKTQAPDGVIKVGIFIVSHNRPGMTF